MKTLKSTKILAFLLMLTSLMHAQEKMSAVKIYPPADRTQRAALIGLLEIDHFQTLDDGAIYAEIGGKEMNLLKSTGYRHEVVIEDVAARVQAENREYFKKLASGMTPEQHRLAFEQTGSIVDEIIPTPSRFEVKSTFGGYYRFSEMEDAMDDLVADFGTGPNAIISKTALPIQTHGLRNIWVIKISDNVATDESEPEVLYLGVQHAREAIGGSSMIFFMQYLCENYATDPRVKALVDNREIYIIACMNPDGWEHNYTLNNNGGGGWRKNRRHNGGSSYGVDLNRNWGIDWSNCAEPIEGASSSCGSGTSTSDTYYGPSVFSEPETRAIRDFTYTREFTVMIDQHSFGPYYSLPFGRPSLPTNVMDPLDNKFYTYVSAAMGNYNGMRAGNSYEALDYEVAGGVKDWMLKGNIGTGSKGKIFGMTGEGGAGVLGTSGTFWPPASQIINLCKGMVFQNIQLLLAAGTYTDLQDESDIVVTDKDGSFSFLARRVGVGNSPVTVSMIPMENISSVGAPVVISSLANYFDTYSGSIDYELPSALTDGQRIRFAWRIQSEGITYYDTVTKFYHSNAATITRFSDNFEGAFSDNWTAANSPTGSTNAWRFTAVGTGRGGGKAMSETAAGSLYGNNNTRTATYNSTINLSGATAAYLSFWVKHRAENFRDKLQVQVSTNGTTWVAIKGTTTVQEPGTRDGSTIDGEPALTGVKEEWTRELFDLQDYLNQPNLRLRFEFTSGPSTTFHYGVDDGFYIDDLKIVATTVPLVTLPVHFISFTGQLLSDETVRLNWVAVTDQQHDRFEVEKSSNGATFVTLGTGPANAPYWMIDPSPYAGNNFYRVKQYDIDGTVTYSNVINVYYNPSKVSVSVFPNPVKDVLTVKINSLIPDNYTLVITDLAGRKVHEEKQQINSTEREFNINMAGKLSQMFIVTVRNGRNEIISTNKITRQ